MKFLLDTNVLVNLEPSSPKELEPNSLLAVRFKELANRAKIQLFVHELQSVDLNNDRNPERKKFRQLLIQKYTTLSKSNHVPREFGEKLEMPPSGSNSFVDCHLLISLLNDSVNYLITEDRGIHRNASRLELSERVLHLQSAIDLLSNLFDRPLPGPPPAEPLLGYQLNREDPIWDSFRDEYPGFDIWLRKVSKEHRQCWVIQSEKTYAAVSIVKNEDPPLFGLPGKQLKICSLKVASAFSGNRFGELMLKTLFSYAKENQYSWLTITVFEHHYHLVNLLEQFGFESLDQRTEQGELVMAKPMMPGLESRLLDGFDFFRRYGPFHLDWQQPVYVVPIVPKFHDLLFPEGKEQFSFLEEPRPCGNSLRKVYLSGSRITPPPIGSVLLFYRSEDIQAIRSIGIVESSFREQSAEKIAHAVGNRTVYTFKEIEEKAQQPVLVILFRYAFGLDKSLKLDDLIQREILLSAPQSIAQLDPSAVGTLKSWIQQ